jgi:hypothetical protein
MDGIRVFSPSSERPDTITNVVYRELLDDNFTTPKPIPVIQQDVTSPLIDDQQDSSESNYDDY